MECHNKLWRARFEEEKARRNRLLAKALLDSDWWKDTVWEGFGEKRRWNPLNLPWLESSESSDQKAELTGVKIYPDLTLPMTVGLLSSKLCEEMSSVNTKYCRYYGWKLEMVGRDAHEPWVEVKGWTHGEVLAIALLITKGGLPQEVLDWPSEIA
jgi:hypothetical protein